MKIFVVYVYNSRFYTFYLSDTMSYYRYNDNDDDDNEDYDYDEYEIENYTGAIKPENLGLEEAPKEHWHNKNFVLDAVHQNGPSLKHASDDLRGDKDVVLAAIQQNGRSLEFACKEFQNDRDMVMTAIQCDQYSCHLDLPLERDAALQYASEELRKDKDVILVAVTKNGRNLQFVSSPQLKNDKEVVLTAVETYEGALQFASESLLNDKDFILEALLMNPKSDTFVPLHLRYSDQDIIIVCAIDQKDPKTYLKENIPDSLWANRDFLIQFFRCCPNGGAALEYASENLQGDQEVILAALRTYPWSLQYVSEDIRANKTFLMKAVQGEGRCLKDACEELRGDQEVVLAAVQQYGRSLKYASKEHRDNKDVALAALRVDGNAMVFVSRRLRADMDVAVTAILQNPTKAILYIPKKLYKHPCIQLALLGIRNPMLLDTNRIPLALWSNILSVSNRHTVYYYLTNKPELVKNATTDQTSNTDFNKTTVTRKRRRISVHDEQAKNISSQH